MQGTSTAVILDDSFATPVCFKNRMDTNCKHMLTLEYVSSNLFTGKTLGHLVFLYLFLTHPGHGLSLCQIRFETGLHTRLQGGGRVGWFNEFTKC